MRLVKAEIEHYYKYEDNYYVVSNRKTVCIGDLIYDSRDNEFKAIESEKDVMDMWCVAPELYVILERMENQK